MEKMPDNEHIPQCQGGLWVANESGSICTYWPGIHCLINSVPTVTTLMIRTIAERVKAFHEEMERRMSQVMAA